MHYNLQMQPGFPGPSQTYPPSWNPNFSSNTSSLKKSLGMFRTKAFLSDITESVPSLSSCSCPYWVLPSMAPKSESSWATWARRTLLLLQPLQTMPLWRCCQESAQKLSFQMAQKLMLRGHPLPPPWLPNTSITSLPKANHLPLSPLCAVSLPWSSLVSVPASWDCRD